MFLNFCLNKDIPFSKCTEHNFCFIIDNEMATVAEKRRCLQVSGEENDLAYWIAKFRDSMLTKTLRGQLLGTDTSNNNKEYNSWAEVVHCLDKLSIMMLKPECKRNRPGAVDDILLQFKDALV